MKQRNLYRIIIGILMLISGLVSLVLASGEFVIGIYSSGRRNCFSHCVGSPDISGMAKIRNLTNVRKRLELTGCHMPG